MKLFLQRLRSRNRNHIGSAIFKSKTDKAIGRERKKDGRETPAKRVADKDEAFEEEMKVR